MSNSRREFIRNTALGAAGMTMLGSGKAFGKILGANNQVNVAIFGMGGRSKALAKSIKQVDEIKLVYVCDVDEIRLNAAKKTMSKGLDYTLKAEKDFRKILEDKDIDAVFVATPEHWHAPMAIMAMQAGKHVYVEKPCSHNPHENELLVQAQKKYGKMCQMGNQQRSSVSSAMAYDDIQNGVIGNAYAAKAFYSSKRGPIGKGKAIPVPETLDWNLWQGPAPREEYKDNIHPYKWHWFKAWGTGEIHNNGTHEIDVCRWMLGVNYPERVVSAGGRLHHSPDDWQFYDTQIANYEFKEGKTLMWEGRSCNKFNPSGGRGSLIYGTKGTIFLNRKVYELYDAKGELVKKEEEGNTGTSNSTSDRSGFDGMTTSHVRNFAMSIIKGEKLHSDINEASISSMLCHLGNIAQDSKLSVEVDPKTGRIIDKNLFKKYWKREYEKGWEPTI